MTWLAARDPGFAQVRHLLNRNGWRVANVRGVWRLYEGRRTIAAAMTTYGMVLRIRALAENYVIRTDAPVAADNDSPSEEVAAVPARKRA